MFIKVNYQFTMKCNKGKQTTKGKEKNLTNKVQRKKMFMGEMKFK